LAEKILEKLEVIDFRARDNNRVGPDVKKNISSARSSPLKSDDSASMIPLSTDYL
jgi:hypothetical protein